jgi:hypothetical protein
VNGPSHYREAERLAAVYKDAIEAVEALPQDTDRQRLDRLHKQSSAQALLSKAQVHATLAVAAATAETYAEQWSGNHNGREWSEAIS